ncbi:hypothetical protein PMI30_05670 [Pseudomonas sp. GM50]|nr:hypothetical protein PMI30_05670 [Pseudomonas sp. GM50]
MEFLEEQVFCGEGACLWRGGLPPLGREAAPDFVRFTALAGFTTAAQPNGGKPPRHKSPSARGAQA